MSDLETATKIAQLALKFGRVQRVTLHEDGVRTESDTDHTVMLGLLACEIAPKELDRGRLAYFALVHDIVEAEAGDTNTLGISEEGKIAKAEREKEAKNTLISKLMPSLGKMSTVVYMLLTYEEQKVPEARYIRLLDKVLPKLTHLLNHCASPKALGFTYERFEAAHHKQYAELAAQYPEFPETLALLKEAMEASQESWKADIGFVSTVHDEVILDVQDVKAVEAFIIEEAMMKMPRGGVPITTEVSTPTHSWFPLPEKGQWWKWGNHPAFQISHDWTLGEYRAEMKKGERTEGDPIFRCVSNDR